MACKGDREQVCPNIQSGEAGKWGRWRDRKGGEEQALEVREADAVLRAEALKTVPRVEDVPRTVSNDLDRRRAVSAFHTQNLHKAREPRRGVLAAPRVPGRRRLRGLGDGYSWHGSRAN